MKKAKILIALLLTLPLLSFSQIDCSGVLKSLVPEDGFQMNSLSKGAPCISGHTYEFIVPVQQGKEYRFIFYASPVFNNDLHFQIIDQNQPAGSNIVMDLPGKLSDGSLPEKNQTVLQAYYDQGLNKEVHPFFTVIPQNTTNLKLVINIDEKTDLIKGCVTVVILDREFGFQ
ncbi:MAG: hypothetical protein JXR68_04650 [Bacteroidales bacterium]|nr:hypothetical protein [Bacteroidales bacterium]